MGRDKLVRHGKHDEIQKREQGSDCQGLCEAVGRKAHPDMPTTDGM
jgi:hypothetical protein